MIELIVLLVVVGLVATIAVPRINRESKRMTVENALTSIRGAVTETGMRARSTGKALSLKLMPGDNQFLVEVSEQNLAMTWVPPANSALSKAEDDGVEPFYISAKPSYDLSSSIEWQPEDDNYDEEDNIMYYFYPDGKHASSDGKNYSPSTLRISSGLSCDFVKTTSGVAGMTMPSAWARSAPPPVRFTRMA